MKTWIIEPRDTVVFRDGAPADGAMRTLSFPWPSTTAGLVRTRAGLVDGVFDDSQREGLLMRTVQGPLLASLHDSGEVGELWAPAPQDCIWHRIEDRRLERRRLAPVVEREDGWKTDLDEAQLELVGPLVELPPLKGAYGPSYWRWSVLENWLVDPSSGPDRFDEPMLRAHFLDGLPREERVHVSIDPALETARDGQLFSTTSLRFVMDDGRRLALTVMTDAPLSPGLVKLGGRSRLSWLRESKVGWPAFPDRLRNALAGQQRLRVMLLTPAAFRAGALPDASRLGARRIVAAAVDRPLAHSGWRLVETERGKQAGPRPSRRLAPAGSIYWLEVDDAARWAEEHWMTCLSDDPQDVRDGFGLCVVGVA